MKNKILICGSWWFYRWSFSKLLFTKFDNELVCADIKPEANCFKYLIKIKNFSLDLKILRVVWKSLKMLIMFLI